MTTNSLTPLNTILEALMISLCGAVVDRVREQTAADTQVLRDRIEALEKQVAANALVDENGEATSAFDHHVIGTMEARIAEVADQLEEVLFERFKQMRAESITDEVGRAIRNGSFTVEFESY